jgi:hypothetical protein
MVEYVCPFSPFSLFVNGFLPFVSSDEHETYVYNAKVNDLEGKLPVCHF